MRLKKKNSEVKLKKNIELNDSKKRQKYIRKEIEDDRGKIVVSIHDIDNGTLKYEQVEVVHIKSKDYRLMIMSDHTPMVGEIEGSIIILMRDEEIYIRNVKGFYLLLNNEFSFIKSELYMDFKEEDMQDKELEN